MLGRKIHVGIILIMFFVYAHDSYGHFHRHFSTENSYSSSIASSLDKIANKNDLPIWIGNYIALFLGLAGILGLPEIVRKYWQERQQIDVNISMGSPDCLKIPMRNSSTLQLAYETYYLRFRVSNIGNHRLENVELAVTELHRKTPNGGFNKVNSFLPMNLKWADFHELMMPSISPMLPKFCDMGHIIKNPSGDLIEDTKLSTYQLINRSKVVLILDTQVTPHTAPNYILPGEYKLKVVASATNAKTKSYWFNISLQNKWTSVEQTMLGKHISVTRRVDG